jgi:hypothetical protein
MPLALEPRTGEFTPYLKFNGKAGRWYTKNENGDEIEVQNMTAIFDLAQIKTGWLLFTEGMAPETTWDNGSIPPQPSPKHKRGFSVNVFSPKELGGLREFSATSNSAIIAIKELYEKYENSPEAKNGLVPVVKCENVLPVKSKFGTNYQPILTITKWVPRPEALPASVSNGHRAPNDVPPPIHDAERATKPATETNSEEF